MTQEDKELLLKDLCARLPYGVILNCCNLVGEKLYTIDSNGLVNNDYDLYEIKPYLFHLSSMSERQCYELSSIRSSFQDCWKYIKTTIPLSTCNFEQIEWLHKNHFDYRGLIEKGLAIDCTNLNIY